MKVKWSVRGVPTYGWYHIKIPDDQFDEDMTEEEKKEVIDEWVRNEFSRKIRHVWEIDE